MTDMSFTAGYAFKSGQAPSSHYTSHRINQNTVVYNPSDDGSSNPQRGSVGGYVVSERPRYSASNSNMNQHEISTGASANILQVVSLHKPGYNPHYRTQQSQGTSETSPTPTSGADGTPAHALDDLPQSYPMIDGEGHQELFLQGLDQDYQGISTHRCPGYD
jgi:hypothetical protein